MLQLLLDEEFWLLVATAAGVLAAAAVFVAGWRRTLSKRLVIATSLNAFFGLWIGLMGTGHLLAVTTKAILGTLPPTTHLWTAIPFGFAIAVPGWWLVARLGPLMKSEATATRQAVWLNAWLAVVLVVPALPLVIPPVLNLAMLTYANKSARRTFVGGPAG